jgi:hypothetical protein
VIGGRVVEGWGSSLKPNLTYLVIHHVIGFLDFLIYFSIFVVARFG